MNVDKIFLESLKQTSEVYNINLYFKYWEEQFILISGFCFIALIIAIALLVVAVFLSPKEVTFEKLTAFECGFESFGDANIVFSIQFFIVGVLFMLFDLELAYLFPWILYLAELSIFSFWIMMFFLLLLVVGFVYEWKKGALDWL